MADKFKWDDHPVVEEKSEQGGFDWSAHQEAASSNEDTKPSMLESLGKGGAKGFTLSFADELAGLAAKAGSWWGSRDLSPDAKALLENEDVYTQARDEYRAAEKAAEEANPKAFLGGNIIGGALLPAGAIGTVAKSAKGLTGLAKYKALLEQGIRLAPAGAAMGAATVVGASEKPIEKIAPLDVAKGAAIGGATSLVAPAAIGAVGPALKGAYNLSKKGASKLSSMAKEVPVVQDWPIAMETIAGKGIDPDVPEQVLALKAKAAQEIEVPAEAVKESITKTKIVPSEEALTELSGELGQQFQGQRDLRYRLIQNELKDAGQNLLSDIDKLGGRLGKGVEEFKQAILKASDETQQTNAVFNFVKKLESEINKKGGSLSNNPDAIRLLDNYKNHIRQAPAKVDRILSTVTSPGKPDVVTKTFKAQGDLAPGELENLLKTSEDIAQTGSQLTKKGDKLTFKTIEEAQIPEQLKPTTDIEHLLNVLESSRLEQKQHKGTALGHAFNEARSDLIKGREELVSKVLGPEEAARSKQVFEGYTAFKHLTDVLPEGSEAEKLISELADIWSTKAPTANQMIRSEKLLDSIRKLDPELADVAKQTMQDVGQKLRDLPEAPSISKIESALIESPKSELASKQLSKTGEVLGLPKEALQSKLALGKSLSSNIQKAKEELKSIDVDTLLNAVQNKENPLNIRASEDFRKFRKVVSDNLGEEAALKLDKDPSNIMQTLRDVQHLSESSGGFLGKTRALNKLAAKGAARGVNYFNTKIVPKLQSASPDQLNNIALKADNLGKAELAKTLRNMTTKDRVARSAALYMLSQNAEQKALIEDLASDQEDSENK